MTQRLSSQDHLFVLTGAGVSAESGLPTFRGVNGLWRGYRVEDVATPEAFSADPALVWQFYSERRQRHKTVHTESRSLRARRVGTRPGRSLLPLHAERGFATRTRRIAASCTYARTHHAVEVLESSVRHEAVRRSQSLSVARGDRALRRMRGVGATSHLLVRRSPVPDGPDASSASGATVLLTSGTIRRGRTSGQLCAHGTPQQSTNDLCRSGGADERNVLR